MDFLMGLVVLVVVGIVILKLYVGMASSAADLAKEVIKSAIRESRDDSGNWDDIK